MDHTGLQSQMLYQFVRTCVLMDVSGRARKEAAAQAIDKARAAMTLGAEVSDNDTAPRNGVDEILD